MAEQFHAFASFNQLSQALADRISRDLNAAIGARGLASLVVPGGTTPGSFFDVLHERVVPWEKVTVTLTDERWVAADSERSNERLVRTRLLVGAECAQFVSLRARRSCARDGTAEIDARVSEIPRPFDVVLAGMGDDGHTASWIPGADGLEQALDVNGRALVGAIEPPAASGLDERVTLTLRALLDAQVIYVLLRGEEKRKTYERALAGRDALAMPIRALIFQDRIPVEFFWSAT